MSKTHKKIFMARFDVADLGIGRVINANKFDYEFRPNVSEEILKERNRFNRLTALGFRCEKEDILYIQSKNGKTDVLFSAYFSHVDDSVFFNSAFSDDRKKLDYAIIPLFFELSIRTKNISKRTLEKLCKPHLLNLDVDVMHQNLSHSQVLKRKEHEEHKLFQTYTLCRSGVFSSDYNLYTVITDIPEEILKLENMLYIRKVHFDTLEIRMEKIIR